MPDQNSRLTAVETKVSAMEADIDRIERRVAATATRADVTELRDELRRYNEFVTHNLWRVVFGLIMLLGALVLAAFGIEKLPSLWGGG